MAYFDTDYFKISDRNADGPRHADIRAVDLSDVIMYVDEPGARDLVAKLTTWLDAPRLAAREKAEVVETRPARDGTGDTKLVRTADFGEWAVISTRGGLYCGWGAWSEGERQARGVFDIVTTKDLP